MSRSPGEPQGADDGFVGIAVEGASGDALVQLAGVPTANQSYTSVKTRWTFSRWWVEHAQG